MPERDNIILQYVCIPDVAQFIIIGCDLADPRLKFYKTYPEVRAGVADLVNLELIEEADGNKYADKNASSASTVMLIEADAKVSKLVESGFRHFVDFGPH